jgi:NTE family protein
MKQIILLITLLACNKTKAQHNLQPQYICMEGSGIKAFAHVGALQVLDSIHGLDSIKAYAGTSGGAIIAALLAVGYTPNELEKIAFEVPMKKIADGKLGKLMLPTYFGKNLGAYNGTQFLVWIKKMLAQKTNNENITFGQLHELALQGKAKDVCITSTNLSTQTLIVFSYRNYYNMPICNAVRASMSIPIVYKPALLDSAGNIYKKQNKTKTLQVMVDGGTLYNYPIGVFDSTCFVNNNATKNEYIFNKNVIGLQLENTHFYAPKKEAIFYKINNSKDYFNALYHIVIDKQTTNIQDNNRTIHISIADISPKIKQLSVLQINTLIASGREGARIFIQ